MAPLTNESAEQILDLPHGPVRVRVDGPAAALPLVGGQFPHALDQRDPADRRGKSRKSRTTRSANPGPHVEAPRTVSVILRELLG